MKTFLAILWRLIRSLPLLLLSPFLLLAAILAICGSDLATARRKRQPFTDRPVASHISASVVIPNWNGRDLLEKYLPSVIEALAGNPDNEVIVVDNGSGDGSADFLRERFPSVRVLALERNLGFGGGSNQGFRAAKSDVVVLLNSDMRVAPDFLAPLLEPFADEKMFAVSCQIFFSDPDKLREETGLTQGWWESGALRVRHRVDPAVTVPFPCFYGGGGSCAFDRSKFLELGGFDQLFRPFYLEDTDLGYQAWKRGWKVLYQPASVVYHEHRGTIGKTFSSKQINRVLKKNFILFCWKNIHEWHRLASHFLFTWASAVLSAFFGDSPERSNLSGLWRAFLELPGALRSRRRAQALAAISDTEVFRRPLGGYFRDRFSQLPKNPEKPGVLFVSPYPICPPIHGGGVFMYQTALELAPVCSLHLVILLDHDWERWNHWELEEKAASVEYFVREEGKPTRSSAILPFAVSDFANADLEWVLHRQMYLREIDVLQLEYMPLGQYGAEFGQLACMLFEHDIYFQSIGRGLAGMPGLVRKIKAVYEYLRSLRYELKLLPHFDRVQICSPENRDYVLSFLPQLNGKLDDNRAGIATSRYEFRPDGREPFSMLFLGSFRHLPNQEALDWFAHKVLPVIVKRCPQARLVIVGSDPPPPHSLPDLKDNLELRGLVEDVRDPLGRYAVFVCPILSGSGMRVKLLEAFSAGIPVVSTRLGAEGLTAKDGDICALADNPSEFADKVVELFHDGEKARQLALRARQQVMSTRDMAALTRNLVESYREVLRAKRGDAAKTARGL
ncbi:MAG TPA: glycosyltransferase [Bryobacteraceae bacterium]|nr:glycosyltransferase [Bryobacteraceae bacterium]